MAMARPAGSLCRPLARLRQSTGLERHWFTDVPKHVYWPSHIGRLIEATATRIRSMVLVFDFPSLRSGRWKRWLELGFRFWKSIESLCRISRRYIWIWNGRAKWRIVGIIGTACSEYCRLCEEDRVFAFRDTYLINVDIGASWVELEDEENKLRRLFKCALGSGRGMVHVDVDDDWVWWGGVVMLVIGLWLHLFDSQSLKFLSE